MAGPPVPDWLTTDFLKKCLQSDEQTPQGLTILSHTVEPAVAEGNNFGSHMFRVKLEYKSLGSETKNHMSLIVKAPVTSGFMEQFDGFLKEIYEKEPNFYNIFINETYKLCQHDIVPKHYTSPNSMCLVLEDLKTSGYIMVDRLKQLDFDHTRLYIMAAAKLHALSAAVYKKKPEVIELVVKEDPMLTMKSKQTSRVMLLGGLHCMTAYLEDKPNYKVYLDVIQEAIENADNLWNVFEEMEERKPALRALIQSDPWCTNMMFKYDNAGKVVAIKLLDYQTLKFTSPVVEFLTFVWASINPDVRKNKLDEIYHLYCDSLNKSLEELGCSERLSFEDLKSEITRMSPLVLMVVCTMVPICIYDGVADINDLVTGNILNIPVKESPVYKSYQGATFNKYYPQLLDQVAKEGVFDYLKEKLKLRKNVV